MTKIRLEIHTTEERIADICRDYWGIDVLGNFAIKVQDIAIKYSMNLIDVHPLVKANSLAFSTSIQCTSCQVFYQFGNRAHVKYQKAYIGESWRCQVCTEPEPDSPPEEIEPPRKINNILPLLYCIIKKLTENYEALKQNLPLHETNFGQPTGNLLIVDSKGYRRNKQFIGLNDGIRLALDQGIPILLIYASGSGERFIERILCEESRIDPFRLRNGHLGSRDWIEITKVSAKLLDAPITIVKLENPASSDPSVMIEAWQRNKYYLPPDQDLSTNP